MSNLVAKGVGSACLADVLAMKIEAPDEARHLTKDHPDVIEATDAARQENELPTRDHSYSCGNDFAFACSFYTLVAATLAVALIYRGSARAQSGYSEYVNFAWSMMLIICTSLATALIGLPVMICCPSTIVKTLLCVTLLLVVCSAVIAFYVFGSIVFTVVCAVITVLLFLYVWMVWSRIPFATINIIVAMTAVRANPGLGLVIFFITVLANAYSMCWAMAFFGELSAGWYEEMNDGTSSSRTADRSP